MTCGGRHQGVAMTRRIAHFNVARLRHPPDDPRVAEFTTNTQRVNAVAERSAGFIWRLADAEATVDGSGGYQAVNTDPQLAISLSLWQRAEDLRFFVKKTLHGAFLRRRTEWFEPWDGPNYVLCWVTTDHIPTQDDGWQRLDLLARDGATDTAFDFSYTPAFGP